jgi:hypothetical protein
LEESAKKFAEFLNKLKESKLNKWLFL